MYLSHSVSNGMMLIMYAILNVKIEKLVTTPSVIPSGFLCPPVAAEDKTIGKIGQIQGAAIVTSPDMNANRISIIVIYCKLLVVTVRLVSDRHYFLLSYRTVIFHHRFFVFHL